MKFYGLLLVLLTGLLFSSCNKDNGLSPQEYLVANNLLDQAEELDRGVYVVYSKKGTGAIPTLADRIKVKYKGMLTDGTVFDEREEYSFNLSRLIVGWQIALTKMPVGSVATIIIPAEVGYGSSETGSIPANSTLVFEIELLDILESLSVDEYIEKNDLKDKVQALDGGVYMIVNKLGDGDKPTIDNNVIVNYTGKLTTEEVFDEGLNASFPLNRLIEGWQIGLVEMPVGTSATLIIPSEKGYGSEYVGTIPGNSTLIFDIDLLDFN